MRAGGSTVASLSSIQKRLMPSPTIQMFEREPIETLVQRGEVQAFFHKGFWQAMDTLRDKHHLEELWNIGKAPWKTW